MVAALNYLKNLLELQRSTPNKTRDITWLEICAYIISVGKLVTGQKKDIGKSRDARELRV